MLADIFAQILRTLWAHKLPWFSRMFGIAWGVGDHFCWSAWKKGSSPATSAVSPSTVKTS